MLTGPVFHYWTSVKESHASVKKSALPKVKTTTHRNSCNRNCYQTRVGIPKGKAVTFLEIGMKSRSNLNWLEQHGATNAKVVVSIPA